jgi:hypothetical protein
MMESSSTFMDILSSLSTYLGHLPAIIACIVLVIAAVLKTGKEKGSVWVLVGALGLTLTSILNPLFFSLIAPLLIEGSAGSAQMFYTVAGLILGLFWAGSLILVAVGIFIRPALRSTPS